VVAATLHAYGVQGEVLVEYVKKPLELQLNTKEVGDKPQS
jgi:hypothetical protein